MKIIDIKKVFFVRQINKVYVDYLKNDFKENGYQNAYPVSVTSDGTLWDGNHRLEAAKFLGWEEIPAIIEDPPNIRKAAHERNRVANNALPETFIDHAQEIWSLLSSGKTQQQVAEEVGWKQPRVNQYLKLKDITQDAWKIITENTNSVIVGDNGNVIKNITDVIFSEGLLRDITSLNPCQQYELVSKISKGNNYKKADFKKDAERYKILNEIWEYIGQSLSGLSKEEIMKCVERSENGIYLREWEENKGKGDQLEKLIHSFVDEWEEKHSFKLYIGDFYKICLEEIKKDSIDYIITDPPYKKEYLHLYEKLAEAAVIILKPGGSLIVMTGQSYLPEIINIFTKHLTYHWVAAYLTPGGQSVQIFPRKVNTFWKPLLWFTKGKYIGKWLGDVTKSAVNDNDKNYHNWGQSESGMLDIIERFTERGDLILDPFCGGGTTGIVSVSIQRKFIGIDIEDKNIKITQGRINNVFNTK